MLSYSSGALYYTDITMAKAAFSQMFENVVVNYQLLDVLQNTLNRLFATVDVKLSIIIIVIFSTYFDE